MQTKIVIRIRNVFVALKLAFMEKIEGFDFELGLLYFGFIDVSQYSHIGHIEYNI